MNNNLQNQSPEHKGHVNLSPELVKAIQARQSIRWEAYGNTYKAVGLSWQSPRQPQTEVIQNVAGVAMAANNESVQGPNPYVNEVQPAVAPAPSDQTGVSFDRNPLMQQVAEPEVHVDPISAAEQIVRDAYDSMGKAGVQ
jgi:hypothetical protein